MVKHKRLEQSKAAQEQGCPGKAETADFLVNLSGEFSASQEK